MSYGGVIIDGVFSGTFSGVGHFDNGTIPAPSISFASDTDTGLFLSAANTIGVSVGGVHITTLDIGGITTTIMSVANGSAAAPSMTFDSYSNKGFYSSVAGGVGLSIAGTLEYFWDTARFAPNGNNVNELGSAGNTWKNIYTSLLTMYGDILPDTLNTRDIGSAANRFRNVYCQGVTTHGILPDTDNVRNIGSSTMRFNQTFSEQVIVGGGTVEACALITVNSANRGVLLSRLTTAQIAAIASVKAGLVVYDTTTNQFKGYNGTAWVILG